MLSLGEEEISFFFTASILPAVFQIGKRRRKTTKTETVSYQGKTKEIRTSLFFLEKEQASAGFLHYLSS